LKNGRERAFISTYQALGFIEHDTLVVLKPGEIPKILLIGQDWTSVEKIREKPDKLQVVRDAISWYQSASYSFRHGTMGSEP
jgi:hypothetical protein